jgi:hypothetical protein
VIGRMDRRGPRILESGSSTSKNSVKRKSNFVEFTFYEVG